MSDGRPAITDRQVISDSAGAPLILLRIAGLAANTLESLHCASVLQHAKKCEQALRRLQGRAAERCDAIHGLVTLHDDANRRQLLDLKRCIHNHRLPATGIHQLRSVLSGIAGLQEDLDSWHTDVCTYRECVAGGDFAIDADWEKVRSSLAALWKNETLRQGVLYAQPEIYRALQEDKAHFKREWKSLRQRDQRWELSLLAYVHRMATKTSPFSTITLTAVGKIDGSTERFPLPDIAARTSLLVVSPGVIGRLARLWLAHPEFSARAPLFPPQVLSVQDGQITFLASAGFIDGLKAREEVVRTVSGSAVAELVVRILCEQPGRYCGPTLKDRLAELLDCEADAAGAILERLQTVGLIRPVLAYDGCRPGALDRLAQEALGCGGAAIDLGPAVAVSVARVLNSVPGKPVCEQASGLATAASHLSAMIGDSAEVTPTHSFFDRCALSDVVRLPAEPVQKVIPQLQQLLTLLPLFNVDLGGQQLVQDFFRDRCARGHAVSVLDGFTQFREFVDSVYRQGNEDPFAQAAANHPVVAEAAAIRQQLLDELRRLTANPGDTPVEIPERLFSRLSHCATRFLPGRTKLSASFLGHFVETSDSPHWRFVLNNVLPGYGMLAAAWAYSAEGYPAGARLKSLLADRLAALDPEGDVAEICAALDFGAQVRERLTEKILNYPDEPLLQGAGHLDWSKLRLAFDSDLNRVALVNRTSGRRVLPLHLGPISPQYFPPFYRFLVALGPAFTPSFSLIDLLEEGVPEDARQSVRRYRRVYAGPVIVSRESWCIPADSLPVLSGKVLSFAEFLNIRQWARSLGLPKRGFVTGAQTLDLLRDGVDALANKRARKPFFVDFDDYSACLLFARFTRRAGPTIRFAELLPDAAENPFRENGVGRVVECVLEVEEARS